MVLHDITQVTSYSTGRRIDGVPTIWQFGGYVGYSLNDEKWYIEWRHGSELFDSDMLEGPFDSMDEAIGFAFRAARVRDCYANVLA